MTKLPMSIKVCYALGQLGWSILVGIISVWLVWFYFPPKDVPIPAAIPQGAVLGFLTTIGIITMAGRLLDALTDPWIANLSDKSKSPKGRRISFMAKGALPFAIFTVLVFCTPVQGVSIINIIWLAVTLLLFYIFYTIYVTPYFALISELGHTPEEKLDLSTYISFTWFIGFVIASAAAYIWPLFENMGIDKVTAIRITFIILSLVGLVFLLIPVFTIEEKKYVKSQPVEMDMLDAVRVVFKNKDFLYFAISDLAYWVALTIFQTGNIYYVTVLLGLKESWITTVTALIGILSFCFYPVVNIVAKKIGKMKLMILAFGLFILAYIYCTFVGKYPFTADIQAYLLIALISMPLAVFGILPNAIIADIAEYDAVKTKTNKEAMFFGVRTFMSKVGQTVAMLCFSSLLLLGKDVGDDLGIRLTGVVAAVLGCVALVVFLKYNEARILGKE